uniref:phage/plasmid primase, P4 family n=1 Tax=Roseovarius sp. TaxID=1486281 RepID=UPI003568D694
RSYVAGKAKGGARWGATTDPEIIRSYWQQFPEAMLGITTGQDSGLFVIDADTPEGHDKDGVGTLRGWIEEYGQLQHTIEATTPSGGWHIYFRWPDDLDIRNSESKLAPGIDVRGEGGMVLAPPTIKPGGSTAYSWNNPPGLFDVADAPAWLMDKIRETQAPKLSERTSPSRLPIDTRGANAWADKALQGELATLLASPEGQRNGALNTAAFNLGQIVAGGSLDEATVKARLSAAAEGIGLEPGETAATINSGFHAGTQTPREPKARTTGGVVTSDGEPRPNVPEDAIDLSHDALASDLGVRSFDRDARHVASWGKWLIWTGTRWQVDDRLDHLTRTRAFLRTRAGEIISWAERKAASDPERADKIMQWADQEARTLRSKTVVAAVESLARSNSASVARADAFDEERLLLGTPGGTVDLRTGHLRKAERGDMITKLTACAPAAPGSRPERWLSFLHEIFDGDADLVDFMQRAAGYALTGLTTEHKLLFLYGTGRNGKSVFLNTLTGLWADYSRRAAATTFLNSMGEKHPTDLAGLQGARLVAGSELPVGKTWDESVIKDLTGGDRMTARFMRGDFFDFDPQLTLMIAGNNQPSFRGVDEAIRARVVLVPFTVTIPPERRDKSLSDKLKAEGPEILRWAIEGALQWLDKGLNVPPKVAAASTEYMDDEDTLAQFLIDETTTDPAGFVTTTDLHERFKFWCERQGLHVWTQHTLRKELKSRGFQDHRRPHGRGFIGLKTR